MKVKRLFFGFLAAALAMIALAGFWLSSGGFGVRAASASSDPAAGSTQPAAEITPPAAVSTIPAPFREGAPAGNSPNISSIEGPSPTCYLPVSGTGVCYVAWDYLYVSAASSQYVISMTVDIDGKLRSYSSGFFQSTMYLDAGYFGKGFKVTCGAPGAGGIPGMGNAYSTVIRARETGGNETTNSSRVVCPADLAKRFLPIVRR